MALAFSIRLDFVDNKGSTSFTKIRVPTTFALSDYIEFGEAAAQLVAKVCTARVTAVSLTVSVDLAGLGLKTSAASVAKVGRKLFFKFATAVTGFIGRTLFPTLKESLVVAGSDNIDMTDTDVAALASAFEDGIVVTGGTVTYTNDRGHDITNTDVAKEQFRRRTAS